MTEHSAAASYAGGLLPESIKRQREEIVRLNEELAPFRVFQGIECEILSDGRLDYSDEVRRSFDFVIASVHSGQNADEEAMTKRICAALTDPSVTILGHPSGRLLLQREAHSADLLQVLDAAAEYGVAVEVNANPRRLDLQWEFHQAAVRLGIPLAVCPDAHSIDGIGDLRWGIAAARKGLLRPDNVLTCRDAASISQFFNSKKRGRRRL